MQDYYKLDLLSNSRLGIVECIVNGLPIIKAKKETLDFGTQLHEAILEPEKYALNLATNPSYKAFRFKIAEMVKVAKKNALLMFYLSNKATKFEQDHFFNEPMYDLECKLKADIILNKTIGDLKTTAARTKEEFELLCIQYGYDRQGAFYLDGTGCNKFIIFAISKHHPYPMFTKEYLLDSDFIKEGRKKIEILINKYIELRHEINFQELMSTA